MGLADRATVNLLFYSEDDPEGTLLFDREVWVQGAEIPGEPDGSQDCILYGVVADDTNGDGRLNQPDDTSLWISDLQGRDLVRLTPDTLAVSTFSVSEDGACVFLTAWINPGDSTVPREHWEQGVYVCDVKQKKLEVLPIDRSLFARARDLLQR